MIKIERTPIELKANIPFPIHPLGGLGIYDTDFLFEYGESVHDKTISFAFKTHSGKVVTRNILFNEGGYQKFIYDGKTENELIETRFDFIELMSNEDLNIIISVKEFGAVTG